MHTSRNPLDTLPSIFTYSDAINATITPSQFRQYCLQKKIIKLSRNTYTTLQTDLSVDAQFQAASAYLKTPAIVCLLSALSYYELTDLIPKQIWLFVASTKRSRRQDLKLIRRTDMRLDIGIIDHNGFQMTSIPRTLIEMVWYDTYVGTQTGIQAIKTAISEDKTSLNDIMNLAKALKMKSKLMPIIQTLL